MNPLIWIVAGVLLLMVVVVVTLGKIKRDNSSQVAEAQNQKKTRVSGGDD
jgi:hypothetical protein